ncbi:MAG TPA: phage tail tape measure protein [Candidatus Desulfovibrio intestinipullorum]|uniref:Phage tail tape measure protein n=1 Tax=Candidatus Desulfovibrio intestinipullorum TaxID=2838536 RepID=A0A9D1PXS2_9BACT|nr:phage tail tape measure protein [Candidatus Desulfovibrio intestinipullorum]
MEVFSIFATLSLVDLVSGPLDRIRGAMGGVNASVASLGQRMGNLALAMAPVALAAGAMIGAFGLAASKAMAFESAMADVRKVVNFDTAAEFDAMNKSVMDMAGRIPMAADGIAAIIAAAGQSGIAKQDLAEFAEQAAKMGVAFDLTGDQAGKMMADWRAGMGLTLPQVYSLADAVNHLSNNMNATAPALGEVIQRVGAVAMTCGLGATQVAALGAAFLSAGAGPEIAATALKNFTGALVRGTAMSKSQAEAFKAIGFEATQLAKDMQTDAQGTIFKVLEALAQKPKELQVSLLSEMFGQESIGAIAPLLKNMDNLRQAFGLVGDAANYAGSMQNEFDVRSKTTENALQLLSNRLTNLAIAVGNAFLPAIGGAASVLGGFVDILRAAAETKVGQAILQIAGAFGTALAAVTALSAAMWFFSAVGPMITKVLLPVKAALLGLSAPVLAVIAALGLLYAAWRTNFGGMADYLSDAWQKITLTVRGVLAVFQNLKDGSGEIRGELATQIKASGLTGLVTTISRVVYRIQALFRGFRDALSASFERIQVIFLPLRMAVAELMQTLGGLFGLFTGNEITSATSSWEAFGATLGELAGGVLEGLAQAFAWVIEGIQQFATIIGYALGWVSSLCSGLFTLTGATSAANDSADPTSWAALGKMLGVVLASVAAVRVGLVAYRGIVMAVSVATKAFAAAQMIVNAALRMSPIGLVITLITALAAAAGYLMSRWDDISAWWSELWDGIGAALDNAWDAITGALSGLGASILAGLQSAWTGVTGWLSGAAKTVAAALSGAWDSAVEGLSGFGTSILAGLQVAWASVIDWLSGAAEAVVATLLSAWTGIGELTATAWAGVTESVSGAWSSIIEGISSFGASLLAGVSEAWNSVRSFFDGLNLYESGARLLGTFIEGIMSRVSALVETVSGALSRVRSYLPFSDAHEGPLSQLTLSGSRLMTTLAEGVKAGSSSLVSTVGGALSSVGNRIQSWWSGQKLEGNPAVSAIGVQPVPALPAMQVPQPQMPAVPPLEVGVAPIPAIAGPQLPDVPAMQVPQPQMPTVPPLEVGVAPIPAIAAPTAPEVPDMQLPRIEAPQIDIPQVATPAMAPADEGFPADQNRAGTDNQSITIYGDIHLPNVKDFQGFMDQLKAAMQEEISPMEGMA